MPEPTVPLGVAECFRDWAATIPPGITHEEAIPLLFAVARKDLQMARLAEAHLDGVIICGEAGRPARAGATFGVWASDGPESRLAAVEYRDGWRIEGTKQYCTGAGIVTDALVTAHAPEGLGLFHLDVTNLGERADASTWRTAAFAETGTATVTFAETAERGQMVGEPGWYLDRPGFWLGAIRVAACWAGGAVGLVDRLAEMRPPREPHGRAHFGALDAISWELELLVRVAAEGGLGSGSAALDAARIRLIIAERCEEVLARTARAGGPAALALDAEFAARFAELQLYIRQHHAERDMEELGRLSRGEG